MNLINFMIEQNKLFKCSSKIIVYKKEYFYHGEEEFGEKDLEKL